MEKMVDIVVGIVVFTGTVFFLALFSGTILFFIWPVAMHAFPALVEAGSIAARLS